MIKKALFIVVCITLANVVFTSCDLHRDCTTTLLPNSFIVGKINSQNEIIEDVVIPMDSFCLYINYVNGESSCVMNNYSFINTAYATTIDISTTVTNRFSSIIVKTLRDYNSNYKVGDNINNIINYRFTDMNYYSKDFEILDSSHNEHILKINSKLGDIFSSSNKSIISLQHYLSLKEKPTNSGDTTQFEVIVNMNDGTIFRDTSKLAVLMY